MRILRRLLALIALLALLGVGWRFAIVNPEAVRIDYLAGAIDGVALWLALLGAFALGLGVAGLWGLYEITKLGLRVRRHRKEREKLAAEIHQLRNLPLSSEGEGLPRGSAGGTPEAGELARSGERGV